jgi:CRP-like cAMP-binding protein
MTGLRQDSVRNSLLQNMEQADFELIQPHLEKVTLNLRDVLVEENRTIEHVWFVEEGLGSVIAMGQDNEQVEVAHVGPEGMAGKAVVLGVDHSTNRTLMQVAGHGLRMPASRMREALSESPTLRPFLLRYVHVGLTQLSQTALANGRYNLQERLARWLLMSHDRLRTDDMALTHEFLSLMLGVRRSGVTEAIHLLEGIHVIKATRGQVRIINRARLEEIAGGCYGLPEAEYNRLIGNPR